MKQKGFSQEALKLIACITMLIDHIGAVLLVPIVQGPGSYEESIRWLWAYYIMRMIGRIAFPIYCFLLVEGAAHTRNPKKYALRLLIGALLAELPFDLALGGEIDWQSNSVMVTLFLGFGMLMVMNRVKGLWKLAAIVPFFFLAEWMWTDYGGNGILIIAMFALTRGVQHEKQWRIAGGLLVLSFGFPVVIGGVSIPIEFFGMAALVPIFCYSGRKRSYSKALQWAFYLFYPVHLLILWAILQWMT